MHQPNGSNTHWIDEHIGVIDLLHQGHPGLISVYLVPTSDGLALIETGPARTLPTLLDGVRMLGHDPAEIRHVLLTHIHLDHAGGAGTLLQQLPDAHLYVHERGARHMIDPSRLLASATRIYGATMDALWGEMLPTPEDRVTALADGDELNLGGLHLDVLYAPGHASHHVVFDDAAHDAVFSGDAAGMRILPDSPVMPPTPPPDIDVAAWHTTINRIRATQRSRLLLAHFGAWDDAGRHLDDLSDRLDRWLDLVADWQADGSERDEIVRRFASHVNRELGDQLDSDQLRNVERFVMPPAMSVDGLLRYISKRDQA